MQPLVLVDDVVRFKCNRIVRWMLDVLGTKGITLNTLALTFKTTGSDKDDYQQLMQLIGYSVSGYGDLSCRDRNVLDKARQMTMAFVKRGKPMKASDATCDACKAAPGEKCAPLALVKMSASGYHAIRVRAARMITTSEQRERNKAQRALEAFRRSNGR